MLNTACSICEYDIHNSCCFTRMSVYNLYCLINFDMAAERMTLWQRQHRNLRRKSFLRNFHLGSINNKLCNILYWWIQRKRFKVVLHESTKSILDALTISKIVVIFQRMMLQKLRYKRVVLSRTTPLHFLINSYISPLQDYVFIYKVFNTLFIFHRGNQVYHSMYFNWGEFILIL